MKKLNLGIFSNRTHAEETIGELKRAGYDPKEISIVMKDVSQANDISESTGAKVTGGAVSGAATGGAIGGLAGLLVGIGAITFPGIGALFIAGPIATALGITGAAATTVSGALTGALAGGLVGGLVSLGIPEKTAQMYQERIIKGGILLAVSTRDNDGDNVRKIMEAHGADQVEDLNVRDLNTVI